MLKLGVRALFIQASQPAVASDIGHGGKPTLYALDGGQQGCSRGQDGMIARADELVLGSQGPRSGGNQPCGAAVFFGVRPRQRCAVLRMEKLPSDAPATLVGTSVAGFVGTGVTTEGVDVATDLDFTSNFRPERDARPVAQHRVGATPPQECAAFVSQRL